MIRSPFHIGFDTSAQFYIPKSDQPPSFLSGMVLTLSMEFDDPTTALTYFSKKEDVDKVHELISESVDLVFLPRHRLDSSISDKGTALERNTFSVHRKNQNNNGGDNTRTGEIR